MSLLKELRCKWFGHRVPPKVVYDDDGLAYVYCTYCKRFIKGLNMPRDVGI